MYGKKCTYCHEPVSIFESVTEFGMHYHESCIIHKLQSEIDAYKKKWINGKMTAGDKADIVDKYDLVQTLMSERTEFKGWEQIGEHKVERRFTHEPDRMLLYADEWGTQPILEDGKLIMIEDNAPSISISNAIMRPNVVKTALPVTRKLLSAEQILQISAPVEKLEIRHDTQDPGPVKVKGYLSESEIEKMENNSLLSSCIKALKPSSTSQEKKWILPGLSQLASETPIETPHKKEQLKPHCSLNTRTCYCLWDDGKIKSCEVGRSTKKIDVSICQTVLNPDVIMFTPEPISIKKSISDAKIEAIS
jgi:hypothetical protein